MTTSRVLLVGPLMSELERGLVVDHGATTLQERQGAPLPGVRVAVTSGRTGVDDALMARLPDLGAIVHFGVGVDRTDLAAAARRGVLVSNTPDVLTDCVADTAVGLVIDVMRGLTRADRFVREGHWEGFHSFPLQRRVTGARIGILGLGRIGLAIARRLEGFECRIGYHNRRPRAGAPYVYHESVRDLAAVSDVLVVAAGGGEGTRALVDATVLRALGPQGFLVNVGRGSVVDEPALVAALRERQIAGAGLDVYAAEPAVPRELLAMEEVVLLPHLASGTVETRRAMADLVLDNVGAFLRSGAVLTPVS